MVKAQMPLPYHSAHQEVHFINRSGWLRAAVLGANDGIVSVSSLIVGVAAADPGPGTVLIAGVAGLAAGATTAAINGKAAATVKVRPEANAACKGLAL